MMELSPDDGTLLQIFNENSLYSERKIAHLPNFWKRYTSTNHQKALGVTTGKLRSSASRRKKFKLAFTSGERKIVDVFSKEK